MHRAPKPGAEKCQVWPLATSGYYIVVSYIIYNLYIIYISSIYSIYANISSKCHETSDKFWPSPGPASQSARRSAGLVAAWAAAPQRTHGKMAVRTWKELEEIHLEKLREIYTKEIVEKRNISGLEIKVTNGRYIRSKSEDQFIEPKNHGKPAPLIVEIWEISSNAPRWPRLLGYTPWNDPCAPHVFLVLK